MIENEQRPGSVRRFFEGKTSTPEGFEERPVQTCIPIPKVCSGFPVSSTLGQSYSGQAGVAEISPQNPQNTGVFCRVSSRDAFPFSRCLETGLGLHSQSTTEQELLRYKPATTDAALRSNFLEVLGDGGERDASEGAFNATRPWSERTTDTR